MASRKKLPYREGDWIAVPLKTGGWAVGVVARQDGRGGIFGYFFGPRRDQVPALGELRGYKPDEAILLSILGDLGLIRNEWPVLGRLEPWEREKWPLTLLRRTDCVSGVHRLIEYDESDLLEEIGSRKAPPEEAMCYPEDGIAGSKSIEAVLDAILSGKLPAWSPAPRPPTDR